MQPADKSLSAIPIPETPRPVLREAVVALVRAKAKIDRMAKGVREEREISVQCGLPAGEDGTSFFQEVFPFAGRWDPIGATELRNVPLDLVMGHSWRWHPENVITEDRELLRKQFLSCTTGTGRAEVCWIVPLGLFLAHEGKNRIEFLRAEGATHYPALTTPYDYPAPERLMLICEADGPHGDEWWAVLDQDLIKPLHCPDWVRPILTAYGVVTATGWPTSFPSYAAVRQAFAERRRRQHHPLEDKSISLKELLAREVMAEKEVCVSLADLPGVRLRRGWKKTMVALAAGAAIAIPVEHPQIQALSMLFLGAALMLPALLYRRILIVPRGQIDSKSL